MLPLLNWGLPGSYYDKLLFGGDEPWPAARYDADEALDTLRTRARGADVDLNPLPHRDAVLDLTATDADRAEILRRYRLYSRQPDEMIIFRALQQMSPRDGDLDPKLYQYGGGYLYPLAGALVAAHQVGFAQLTSDAAFYLEHPDAFARFYVVARLLSLVFGALALVAVHKLARRVGGRRAGWLAMVCVALSPVFITAVVEAKPHLPSACLLLWAALSALDYHRSERLRDAVRLGLQVGYAFGLVLTGIVGLVLWPALLLTRPARLRDATTWQHLLVAGVLVVTVYGATNPYVAYNLVFDRAALAGNLGNSTAMYEDQAQRITDGAARVAALLVESVGWGVLVAGLLGLGLLLRRWPRRTGLVVALGVAFVLMGALLGAGKPAEFARFLVLPAMLLATATGCVLGGLARRRIVLGAVATVVVLGTMHTPAYVRALIADASGIHESRYQAGLMLAEHAGPDAAIGVLQEPAPYAVPPLDYTRRTVLLLPPTAPVGMQHDALPAWLVFTADDAAVHAGAWWHAHYALDARFPPRGTGLSRITWANKPVFVYRKVAE